MWFEKPAPAAVASPEVPRVQGRAAARLIEPARRGVEIASQVVRTYDDYTKDPAELYAARRQVIEEIQDENAKPLIYDYNTAAGGPSKELEPKVQLGICQSLVCSQKKIFKPSLLILRDSSAANC